MSNGSFFALCALILITPKMGEETKAIGFWLFLILSLISSYGAWLK
jgi:hypothetical protein